MFRILLCICAVSSVFALDVRRTNPAVVTGAQIDESLVSVTLHVDQGGVAGSSGSLEQPIPSLSEAIERAKGELREGRSVKIALAPGLYREGSLIIDGHMLGAAARDAVLVIEGGPGVILSGAEDWSQRTWTNVPATVTSPAYIVTEWPFEFGLKGPGWGQYDPKGLAAYRREMLFVNGQMLPDVFLERYVKDGKGPMGYTGCDALGQRLRPGTFAVTERAENEKKLYVALPVGMGQASAQIEVAVHPFILTFSGMRNIVVRGLEFRHAASTHKHQALMIGSPAWMEFGGTNDDTSWNNEQVLIEDVSCCWNNTNGIGVDRCDGLTLRRVRSNWNGIGGIRNWTIRNLLIEDLETSYNNWRGERGGLVGWGIAGMKSHGVFDAVVRNHRAIGNRTEGQWWDIDNRNITIDGLVAIANRNRGLFLEISPGPFAIRNSVIGDSETTAAFRLDCAQDVSISDSIFFSGPLGNDVINVTAKLAPKTRSTPQGTMSLVSGRALGSLKVNSGPLQITCCLISAAKPATTLFFMNSSPTDSYASMMAGERYAGVDNQFWHASEPLPFGVGFEKQSLDNFATWTVFSAEISPRWEDPGYLDLGNYNLSRGSDATGYTMPAATLAELRAFQALMAHMPIDEAIEIQGEGGDASFTK